MSKLKSKSQATVPKAIHNPFHLREDDSIAYVISGGEVIIQKAALLAIEEPFGTFTEWDSEADRKAYGNL